MDQKRRRWVDPNQLELPTPVAKRDAQPQPPRKHSGDLSRSRSATRLQKHSGDSSRSRERIHAMWIVCIIVLCSPGIPLVPQLLHVDIGPVLEAFDLALASFSPLITLIASFYFTRSGK